MPTSTGYVRSVNIVHELLEGPSRRTAIDKRPVHGRVEVNELGLVADTQCDVRTHGGVDKAVYAYAAEDSAWWAEQLDRDIPPGQFGENLTVAGIDVTNAVIGERWRIGGPQRGVVLEVRLPRTPCSNLAWHMGIHRFHQTFDKSGRVGTMLKVCRPGTVGAGDPIRIESRPSHGVTVRQVSDGITGVQAQRLLDSGQDVAADLCRKIDRVLARARA